MKILMLHGWTYSTEKWSPFFDLLKDNYYVKLLKIPGLTEDLKEVWNLDNYVDWLKKKVDKEKGKIILIGHSNGGRISLAFSHKYPEKVAKLILIDSAGIYHNELSVRLKRLIFGKVAKIGKKFTDSESLRKFVYKIAREGDYSNATIAQRQTMVNLINSDLTDIIKKVKIPTLIIWGAQDKVTPLTDGQLMHSLIKNSQLSIIKDAGHSPQFTNPKEVAKIINEFI